MTSDEFKDDYFFKVIYNSIEINWQEYLQLKKTYRKLNYLADELNLKFINTKLEKITDKQGFVIIDKQGDIKDYLGAYKEKTTRFVEKQEAERFIQALYKIPENKFESFSTLAIS